MSQYLRHIAAFLTLLVLASGAWAAGEVQLLSARSTECSLGISNCPSANMTVFIEVKNIAYVKQVGVRYRNSAGAWVSAAAQYFMPTTAGKELWYASLPAPSESFALYYTVNGATYWDNNGGRNYSTARFTQDALLGTSPINDAEGFWGSSPSTGPALFGSVRVRNMGSNRQVKAVYTDDNWLTTKVGHATYQSTLPSGIEVWNFVLPTSVTATTNKIQLSFNYTWTGTGGIGGSAWDNSFGRNYGVHSQYFIARR